MLHFALFFKKVNFRTFNLDPFSLGRFWAEQPNVDSFAWILLHKLQKCGSSSLPDESLTFTFLVRAAEFVHSLFFFFFFLVFA